MDRIAEQKPEKAVIKLAGTKRITSSAGRGESR
jgi:hypothetical protein